MNYEGYSKIKGYIYIAFATVLFSTMEIGLKYTSKGFNPMQLTMIRFLIGGIASSKRIIKVLLENIL